MRSPRGSAAVPSTARKPSRLRFLLDEHYPGWLATALSAAGVDAIAIVAHRPDLRGAPDDRVLREAAADGRVVVTEDITTFLIATRLVGHQLGVVMCHPTRFPRTKPGLDTMRRALEAIAAAPPDGLGEYPVVWWLDLPE